MLLDKALTSEDDEILDKQLENVITDWLQAAQCGQAPELAVLLQRHPQYADELSRFYKDFELIHGLTVPFRHVSVNPIQANPQFKDTPVLAKNISQTERAEHPFSWPKLDGYKLVSILGHGGMGVVYEACQISLDRPVALKMLSSRLQDSSVEIERFKREAAIVAKLDHPGIVPIYEISEGGGLPFFSMKLVENGNLAQFVDTARPTINTAEQRRFAQIVAAAARAVQHAHERGILHRDLKPSNILLEASGQPVVADFCLAKRFESVSDLTQTGAILGTPSYMAPEQLRGRKAVLTPATDVYGLGAVLFALLCGHPPFGNEDVLQTIKMVEGQIPVWPVKAASIDRDLQTICLKCLEKNPDQRYASAAALADELDRWLANKPIVARRITRLHRNWKEFLRKPQIHTVAITLAIGIVAAATGLSWFATSPRGGQQGVPDFRPENPNASPGAKELLYIKSIREAKRVRESGDYDRLQAILKNCETTTDAESLKGFEFRYLANLAKTFEESALVGHSSDIYSFAVSPDQHFVATGDKQGILKIWNLAGRKEIRELCKPNYSKAPTTTAQNTDPASLAHGGEITCVRFSPDGRTLATTGIDFTIKLWNVADWNLRDTLLGHQHTAYSLCFSPDGQRIFSGDRTGTLRLWNTATTKLEHAWQGHAEVIHCVAWSPDGKLLASAGDRTVKIWDATTFGEINKRTSHGGVVLSLQFSPDSKLLASGGHDCVLQCGEVRSASLSTWIGTEGVVCLLRFSPRGDELLAFTTDGSIKAWDTQLMKVSSKPMWKCHIPATKGARSGFPPNYYHIRDAQLLNEGTVLALASHSQVKFLHLGNLAGVETQRCQHPGDFVSPDHSRGVWLGPRPTLWYNTISKPMESLGDIPSAPPNSPCCAFSSTEDLVAISRGTQFVTLYDCREKKVIQTLKIPDSSINQLAFAPQGGILAGVTQEGQILMWHARSGKILNKFTRVPGTSHIEQFSPEGDLLVEGSHTNVTVYDWKNNRQSATFILGNNVSAVAFSNGGDLVALGDVRGHIGIWDTRTGAELGTLEGHSGRITSLCYSPDNKTLASSSADKTVRLWHIKSPSDLLESFELPCRNCTVSNLAFAPDGTDLKANGNTDQGEQFFLTWRASPIGGER
ncbi:hypothetical protein BH10PLA2_BH10PLA2_05600 [soil metagenome]